LSWQRGERSEKRGSDQVVSAHASVRYSAGGAKRFVIFRRVWYNMSEKWKKGVFLNDKERFGFCGGRDKADPSQ